jgi:hypothetical protein
MKKISKLLVGILFSALVISPSYAGEMSVTGSAKASYVTNGSDGSGGKNVGVANELDFTANGELDNGFTWKYQVQLDDAGAGNDDTRLEIGTDMGTLGFYISEGGLRNQLAHGIGALGTGYDYASTSTFQAGYNVDGYANVQYHTPADMLPLGAQIKVGYVPNMNNTAGTSFKGAVSNPGTQAEGRDMQQVAISMSPLDGLTIKGDAAEVNAHQSVNTTGDDGVSANLGAKYTMGQFSVGYTEGGYQPATGLTADDETVYYENKYYGIQFDLNDAVSLSYNVDESEKNTRAAVATAATAGTKTIVAMEQETFQLAYTIGGATIGIADIDTTNADYTAGKEEAMTVVSLVVDF